PPSCSDHARRAASRETAFEQFRVKPVGLGAPVLARYGYAGCVNDMGFDTASPEPARQPEAVTAGLEGDSNPFDPMSCFLRFLPPAMEQFQQRALIDRELLQRRALDARHDTGDQPIRLAHLDHGD